MPYNGMINHPAATATVGDGQLESENRRIAIEEEIAANEGFKSAGKYDQNKYKSEGFSYPIDINNPEYGNNYVVFYINVQQDSKLLKKPETETVNEIVPSARRAAIANEKYGASQIKAVATVIGAAGGGGAALVTNAAKGLPGGALTQVGIGAGLGYAVGDIVASQLPAVSRGVKRLKSVITLHVPNTLNISYNTQYSEEDTMAGQAALQAAGFALDQAKALGDNITKGLDAIINQASDAWTTGLAGSSGAIAAYGISKLPNAVQASAGLAPNPKKEQLFKGVDFRTFTFDYQFYPRNVNEAKNVKNIINQFKLHMHPEYKDDGAWLFLYPSEFDIVYYHKDEENMNIHRHTSCVLTSMNVNYTPQGQFTTFEGGMPTQINVTLTFKELAILTKENIDAYKF